MSVEIIITAGIGLAAAYLMYRNIKKSASGECTSCKDSTKGNNCCPGCHTNQGK